MFSVHFNSPVEFCIRIFLSNIVSADHISSCVYTDITMYEYTWLYIYNACAYNSNVMFGLNILTPGKPLLFA